MFLLIFLATAFSVAKEKNTNSIEKFIGDYILEYSLTHNKKKPDAIFIAKIESSKIIVKDVPRLASLGYLNSNEYASGMVLNVLCFYHFDEFKDKMFSKVPDKLKRKSQRKNKIKINGIELLISNTSTEWEPTLEIIYDFKKNKIRNNLLKNKIDTLKIY